MKSLTKIIFFIFFINFSYINADILNIDDKTDKYDLLKHSSIFIDYSNSLKINHVQKRNIPFQENNESLLGYGYSPDFTVWVKFTLKNSTNKRIEKILEYDNSLTSYISFFDISSKKEMKEGLFNINKNRKTLTPTFRITLEPNETKTYYLKASSYITTLIIKLNLWDYDTFYKKEIKHQLILALFFGAMSILTMYNLFIFFFTKDISYLYYIFYIFGVISHQSLYVGLAHIYFIPPKLMIYFIEYAAIFVAFPVFALALFTKEFLQINQYPKINKILTIFLILVPITTIFFVVTNDFNKYRNILLLCLLTYLISITIYSALKRNRHAYFILFGWIIVFVAMIFMFLSSSGIFNIYEYFPYIIEVSLILEGIIFSIALADRINTLQKEKYEVNKQLVIQEENEKQTLKIQVKEKTLDLKVALEAKGLLLQELNHRVKNNMQTVVSLIKLQSNEIEDKKYRDILATIQNRINAMSHLHELLYKENDITHVNAYEYFFVLVEELRHSYDSNITIDLEIKTELKMEEAIYCGLILNELVTNSFKYAFPKHTGHIAIKLFKQNNLVKLIVTDNGIGYIKKEKPNSLGLILIDTLTQKQLKGHIDTKSDNGVKVQISWKDEDT